MVVLHDLLGFSYKEITQIAGVALLGTVKSRLFYGREALRKILSSRLSGKVRVMFRNCPGPNTAFSIFGRGAFRAQMAQNWLAFGKMLSLPRQAGRAGAGKKKLVAQLPHRPAPEIRITAQQSPPKAAGKKMALGFLPDCSRCALAGFFCPPASTTGGRCGRGVFADSPSI